MTAVLKSLGKTPLVVAQGEIDHDSCGALEETIESALAQGHQTLLLDLTEVAYIDSGGLSVLFSTGRRLRDTGWLGLVGPNPSVLRLLELVGVLVDGAFRVFPDLAAARSALSEGDGSP